jgi:hypothetical protein
MRKIGHHARSDLAADKSSLNKAIAAPPIPGSTMTIPSGIRTRRAQGSDSLIPSLAVDLFICRLLAMIPDQKRQDGPQGIRSRLTGFRSP